MKKERYIYILKAEHQILHIRKQTIRKILRPNWCIKIVDTMKIRKKDVKSHKVRNQENLEERNKTSKSKVPRKSRNTNRISKNGFQENPALQIKYSKRRHPESNEMQKGYRKRRYQYKPEINKKYQK